MYKIPKSKMLGLLLCIFSLVLSGCAIKQNQLVIIDSSQDANVSIGDNINIGKIDKTKITNDMQKSETLLQNIDSETIPLCFNPNYSLLASMQMAKNKSSDEINRRVISGNYYQYINLFITSTENGKRTLIGQFLNPKDFSFDESGNSFAFVDGSNCVYIYSSVTNQLKTIVEGKKSYTHKSVSWSKDGNRIIVDNRSVYDVASGQLISVAVDSYMPFIRKNFGEDFYLVTMKNNDYQDMLSLYDYRTKSFKSLTNGVYCDSNYMSLLYFKNDNKALALLNLRTLENLTIEKSQVYSAAILKQSGNIVYTVQNENQDSFKRYQLVIYSPETKQKIRYDIESPSFYLSPASDKLTFMPAYSESRLVKETKAFTNTSYMYQNDEANLNEIKCLVTEMFDLDYNFVGSYPQYEKKAREIYANSYDPLPQEALENKLLDFKRYNDPIPPNQKKFGLPTEIIYNEFVLSGNRASIKVDNYWTNSIELEKISGKWRIIGFSTHPNSIALARVRFTVSNHLLNIKNRNKKLSFRYWSDEKYSNFSDDQIKLVETIMEESQKYSIAIGEVEFWNSIDAHRADDPNTADTAKVKIIFHSVSNDMINKLILKKNESGNFEIYSWDIDPKKVSQLN